MSEHWSFRLERAMGPGWRCERVSRCRWWLYGPAGEMFRVAERCWWRRDGWVFCGGRGWPERMAEQIQAWLTDQPQIGPCTSTARTLHPRQEVSDE